MSQKTKDPQTKEEALEIIELATDDIEVLIRAFNLISEICTEIEVDDEEVSEEQESTIYLH